MTPTPLSPAETDRLIAAVADLTPDLLALTTELVACRSDSQSADNPEFTPEAERCQRIVGERLTGLGFAVEQWREDDRYPVTAARLPGRGGGKSLAINGHIDVVPGGDPAAWSHDPWRGDIADGRLWGRGSADMKGGVACGMIAAAALLRAEIARAGDLWLHVVADEEVVGWSTRRLLQTLPRVDAVIVAEPTDLQIMPVEGGLIHLRIEIEGRGSHAGNRYRSIHAGGLGAEPGAGVNALDKGIKIASALAELEREWANLRAHPMLPPGFNSIMLGMMTGGPGGGANGQLHAVSNPGTCPDYCSLEYNIWYLPDETFEEIQHEIETFVHAVCQTDAWLRAHPPRLTWKLRNIFFPPADTPRDHPLIAALGDALTTLGREPAITAFGAASELAWYAEQGIPGAIFGPGRIAQAHGPDEYVEVEQLQLACTAMALAAASWLR